MAHPPSSSSGIQLTRDAEYLIDSFLPGADSLPPYDAPQLHLPYCVPQITPGFEAPFARGYNPAMENVHINQRQLLSFIDGLNLAMTASPPLRVVDLAGLVIGFVPYHWAMLAGNALQAAASVGTYLVSKTLTDRYLRAANLRLFNPRGLSVRMCTTAAMQRLVMHAPAAKAPSKLNRFGRSVGGVLMQLPLPGTSALVHAVADAPPRISATDPRGHGSVHSRKLLATQRRMAALEGHALVLDFDNVLKPAKAEGVMDTMSAWSVKFDAWLEGRRQEKVEKRRFKLQQMEQRWEHGGPAYRHWNDGRQGGEYAAPGAPDFYSDINHASGSGSTRYGSNYSAGAGAHAHFPGQSRFDGRVPVGSSVHSVRAYRGKDEKKLAKKVADADLQEHWDSAKVLWLVIMNSDMDQNIQGIELAEAHENVERVDKHVWQTEMNAPRPESNFHFDSELWRQSVIASQVRRE
ncbi:hypothetical protein C8R43DRAFT_206451 [Mycena crocata]|nr:hypothetical protein C8R43DRAFT_206451 [Mycena crocata]